MKSSGGIVCAGVVDGNDGYSTVVVQLFRRSASALGDNDRPNGTLTYTFADGKLRNSQGQTSGTGFNSWSQTVPAVTAGTKLYVTMATARSTNTTDNILQNEWSTPSEYVADGMNSAPVIIFKRSATQPTDKPANGCVYTFATGVLSGTLNGWSTQIPANDGNPCWCRHATAVSSSSTDTINASEWSDPAVKFVEDGKNAVRIDLDNQADIISCTADGKVRFARNVVVKARIYDGGGVASSGVTKDSSLTPANMAIGGCTPTVSDVVSGVVTITWAFTAGMSVSAGTYAKTIKLVYGGKAYEAKFNLATTNDTCIYQLVPSHNAISFTRNSSNALTPSAIQVSCGYSKTTADGITAVGGEDAWSQCRYTQDGEQRYRKIDGKYFIFYRFINNDGTATGWGFMCTRSSYYHEIPSGTTYTAVEFALSTIGDSSSNVNDSNILDRETIPITKDGINGTPGSSAWVADLNNDMDSVGCDDRSHPVSSQTVRTSLMLYYGAVAKSFKVTAITRNGSSLGTGVSANITPSSSTSYNTPKELTITYTPDATISGKDDFAITLVAVENSSVTQTLHFTVNGIIGDVYNLQPLEEKIVAQYDGTTYTVDGSTSYNLKCGYTKNVNGTVTTVKDVTGGVVDGKYYMFYRSRRRSDKKWLNWNSSSQQTTYEEGNNIYPMYERLNENEMVDINTYDAFEIVLTANGAAHTGGYSISDIQAIDREIIYVVSDGKEGANGKDGKDGLNGIALVSHLTHWARNNSGTIAPTSWGNSPLSPTTSNKYVWRKDVWTYDAPEKGRNLLRNTKDPYVNNGLWSTDGGQTTTNVTGDLPINDVDSVLQMISGSTSYCNIQQYMTLKAGKLTLSCYVKGNSGISVYLQPFWKSGSTNPSQAFACNGTWQRISLTVDVPSDGNYACGIIGMSGQGSGKTVKIGAMKMEYGEEATDWCQAPEDMNLEEVYVWSVYGDVPTVTIGNNKHWYIDGVDTGVKAEGDDGTGVEIKGSVQKYNTTTGYTSLQSLTGMSKGECYIVDENRHLYLYLASGSWPNNWKDLGEFKGKDGDSSYMHIAWADNITFASDGKTPNSATGFITVYDGNEHKWIGFCTDNNSADPTSYTAYKWNYLKGKDGDGYEYVYYRTTVETTPTLSETYDDPSGKSKTDDEYLPSITNGGSIGSSGYNSTTRKYHCSDDPLGVTSTYKYEYISVRKKTNGAWGAFSSMVIHNRWAKDGQYYVDEFARSTSRTNYAPGYIDSSTGTSDYDGQNGWTTGAPSPTTTYPYIWKRSVRIDPNTNDYTIVSYVCLTGPQGPRGNDSTVAGPPGATGKMFFSMGTYTPGTVYERTTDFIPMVFYDNGVWNEALGTTGNYYYLAENKTGTNVTPGTDNTVWVPASSFGIVITQGIFAEFAKLGSFIISGDFLISQCGTIVAAGSSYAVNEGSALLKRYYQNGIKSGYGFPSYMYFDANDPMAENVVGNTNTFTINGNGEMECAIVKRIYFYASQATSLKITITPSSETSYDFGAVGLLDKKTLSDENVDAGTIKDGETPTLVKASGTSAVSTTISISQGAHFLEIGYFKDNSTDSNYDRATFKFEEQSNSYIGSYSEMKFRPAKVINAQTGAEIMAGGKVRISAKGDVVMNDITVNNAIIRGSLLYRKVLVSSKDISEQGSQLFTMYNASGYEVPRSNTTTAIAKVTLNCDTFILTGNKRDYTVFLPPASLFPGASIKIINGTYSGGNGVTKSSDPSRITLAVVYRSSTEDLDDDNYGYAKNNFTAGIPFVFSSGATDVTLVGAPQSSKLTYLSYDSYGIVMSNAKLYKYIEVVSCPNVEAGDGSNYAWMIIDAMEQI